MRFLSVAVLVAATASFCPAAALPEAEKTVDDLFRPVADGKSPGGAVAVIADGKVVLMKGYGMADVQSATPNTPFTIFRLASITKTFTATAVLQLIESGKIKLDDPLARYIPDFPNSDKIRISHLLSHTAGVPDFIPYEEVKQRGLEFEPGSRINYSNNGYYALGRVIEKVSGQPWDEYLRDHIFIPLGMKHTGYDATRELPGRATSYVVTEKRAYASVFVPDAKAAYAGGGLYSTIEDMIRWEQGLASGKVLPMRILHKAGTPGTLTDGRRTAYGLGWMTSTYRGLREIGHGGDITGFNTYIARYPDEKFAVIVLSNVGMMPPGPLPSAGDLAHRIAEIWLGDRMEKPGSAPFIEVSPATLDAYTGKYKIEAPEVVLRNTGTHIVITRDGDRLVAEGNGTKARLEAKSQTAFQAPRSPVELTFTSVDGGKCRTLVITLMGLREFHATRVD